MGGGLWGWVGEVRVNAMEEEVLILWLFTLYFLCDMRTYLILIICCDFVFIVGQWSNGRDTVLKRRLNSGRSVNKFPSRSLNPRSGSPLRRLHVLAVLVCVLLWVFHLPSAYQKHACYFHTVSWIIVDLSCMWSAIGLLTSAGCSPKVSCDKHQITRHHNEDRCSLKLTKWRGNINSGR